MKKIELIIAAFLAVAIIACGNSTESKVNAAAVAEVVDETKGSIIGTWIPIGMDYNLEGVTKPSGKWHYTDEKDLQALKEAGLTVEDTNLTFKANGTGYMGKKEPTDGDGAFKWKKLPNGKVFVDDGEIKNTNAENIDVFYLDTKGQLIHHTSSKPLLMGKEAIQNSFELYKRK
jgi:hypothetical protein